MTRSFFFLTSNISSGPLAAIGSSFCISQSQRILYVTFFGWILVCIYHVLVESNFNYLHNYKSITFLTQSCFVLHSFCTNLLYSLIMWLIVSYLSPHNLHLLLLHTINFRFDIIGPNNIILPLWEFFTLMIFHWSLSDSKSLHVSRYEWSGRQIHLPRKQCLINRKRHRHAANEGMDSSR